jgi:hypothetical protein
MLLDVVVYVVVAVELPCESDVVGSLRRWAEYEFANFQILKKLQGLSRGNILEVRMVDPSLDKAGILLTRPYSLEGRVLQILIRDVSSIGVCLLNECRVTLQGFPLAVHKH